MWRKICHVEKLQISIHDICEEIGNFSTSGMCVMWRMFPHRYNLCCFVVKSALSRFTLFCRKICFVVIYATLCRDILNQKLRMWRKYDKYEVDNV